MSNRFTLPTSHEELLDLQRRTTELRRQHRVRIALSKLAPRGATAATQQAILDRYETHEALFAVAGEPSAATVKAYRKIAVPLLDAATKSDRNVWALVEERAGVPKSWYAMKAAVQFVLLDTIRLSKQVIDGWLRAQQGVRTNHEVREAFELAQFMLVTHANALDATPTGGLPEKFAGVSTRSINSKSRSIQGRPANWRERIAQTLPEDLKVPYLIQAVTGCRNEELVRGVSVVLLDGGWLECTVVGAKCGKHAGQEQRTFKVSMSSGGVVAMLGALMRPGLPVQSTALVSKADTYRKAVARASARVFPAKRAVRQLSAYSLRHQFKKDASQTVSREDEARAMGHATTRSACAYGNGGKSGSGAVTPHAIKATRAIKVRASFPGDASAKRAGTALAAAKPRARKAKP